MTAPPASTPEHLARPLTHRDILAISVPVILSNVTTPLVGLVDTAVIGQLGLASAMGGVAISAMLFSLLYWTFGFLRLGTSGMTAQAYGAGEGHEIAATLQRALLAALALGLALIALQGPIGAMGLGLMGGSPEVQAAARDYFDMRIWGAPASFGNYALLGWLTGLGRAGRAFALQLLINGLNIALAILFVLGWNWGVPGVAAATVIAEYGGLAAGLALAYPELRRRGWLADWARLLDPAKLESTFAINANIMIRSLCLMLAFTYFTAQGARFGDTILAANAVLFDLFGLAAYLLDGFSQSAETFVGQAVGAKRRDRLLESVWLSSLWAGVLSFVAGGLLLAYGGAIADLMTTNAEVRAVVREFLPWAALSPVLGFAAFQLDGIFIGATRGPDMRNAMLLSLAVFLLASFWLQASYGNHGLWAALMLFLVVRGLTLGARLPALVRESVG